MDSNRGIVAGYPGTMASPVRNWRVSRRSMRRPTPDRQGHGSTYPLTPSLVFLTIRHLYHALEARRP